MLFWSCRFMWIHSQAAQHLCPCMEQWSNSAHSCVNSNVSATTGCFMIQCSLVFSCRQVINSNCCACSASEGICHSRLLAAYNGPKQVNLLVCSKSMAAIAICWEPLQLRQTILHGIANLDQNLSQCVLAVGAVWLHSSFSSEHSLIQHQSKARMRCLGYHACLQSKLHSIGLHAVRKKTCCLALSCCICLQQFLISSMLQARLQRSCWCMTLRA